MRIRWSRDPEELPQPGEALARLRHTRVDRVAVTSGATMTRFAEYRISVETGDGRVLVAEVPGSDSPHAAPLIPSDAPADLVDLLNRAWRARQGVGRPRGSTAIDDAGAERLRDAVREMRRDGRGTTIENVAALSFYTVAAIRGYLRRTRQTWREFLDSF